MDINIDRLFKRLGPSCKTAMEAALGICIRHEYERVEIEHFLYCLLEDPQSEIFNLLRRFCFSTSPEDLHPEFGKRIKTFKKGFKNQPNLSPNLVTLLNEALQGASLNTGRAVIFPESIIWAIFESQSYGQKLIEDSPILSLIPREAFLKEIWPENQDFSPVEQDTSSTTVPEQTSTWKPPFQNQQKPQNSHPTEALSYEIDPRIKEYRATNPKKESRPMGLDKYTIDLTEMARKGKIDPIQGRDGEIRQIIDILTRRRQNNPIITGEAGVGKTAVVEGFALKIIHKEVPPSLLNVSIHLLDLGLLQAGTGVRGEFETRLKAVISEVKYSKIPIILFIDEAHTLIGAGGAAGQGDAANLLKPALARGELRTIAATTHSEYKRYFEKDPALARRFQEVKVDEPSEEVATNMLRGLKASLEKHHNVQILDVAIRRAVSLSHRFITGKKLPDKAISLLDTACARVSISQKSIPPEIEDLIQTINNLQQEIKILELETFGDESSQNKIIQLKLKKDTLEKQKIDLESKWKKELELVETINALNKDSSLHHKNNDKKLVQTIKKLDKIQGEDPMVFPYVEEKNIAKVIAGWTGIPVGKMLAKEIDTILHLEEIMAEKIIGQKQALSTITRRIRTSRASLDDPNRPIGVFLLTGPSGVGKTETALILAEKLYGGEKNVITINMSEYQESHTVSSLRGSPPGYVGYGEGGILTEAVRKNPYSIVLLDESEKAHPDVMELFYQVFDKGNMDDGEGVAVDFKNTLIFLTSNLGSETITDLYLQNKGETPINKTLKSIRNELVLKFKNALLARLTIVPYFPLGNAEMEKIVGLKLTKIKERFKKQHKAELIYTKELIRYITNQSTQIENGARNIDQILTHDLLPGLSKKILETIALGEGFSEVTIKQNRTKDFVFEFQQ